MDYIAIALVAIAVWLAFGVAAIGWYFAYFQRKWPSLRKDDFYEDRGDALTFAIGGPITFIVHGLAYSSFGWLWPWSAKAREEAGI